MEDILKNKLVLILGIVSLIFFVMFVASFSYSNKLRSYRDKEQIKRMDLEEKVSKVMQEKQALSQKQDVLARELEAVKATLESTKKALLQEQIVNQGLKEEVAKMAKSKETIPTDLSDMSYSIETDAAVK